jgi:hypothetical protein
VFVFETKKETSKNSQAVESFSFAVMTVRVTEVRVPLWGQPVKAYKFETLELHDAMMDENRLEMRVTLLPGAVAEFVGQFVIQAGPSGTKHQPTSTVFQVVKTSASINSLTLHLGKNSVRDIKFVHELLVYKTSNPCLRCAGRVVELSGGKRTCADCGRERVVEESPADIDPVMSSICVSVPRF